MSNHYNEIWLEHRYEEACEWAYEQGHDDSSSDFEDIVEARLQEIFEAFE